jgi:hypothetical protein
MVWKIIKKILMPCICEDLYEEIQKLEDEIELWKKKCEELKDEEIEEPNIKHLIDYSSLMNILKIAMPSTQIYLSDNVFGLISMEDAKRFLKEDKTNLKKYEREVYDCDDFSRVLWFYWRDWNSILAIGMAWSNVHAFNIMITDDKKIWVVEPQLDKIYELKDIKNKSQYWPIRFIII